MSILICSAKKGGCGHVADGGEWKDGDSDDEVLCPKCDEDHCFQLTDENFDMLTNESNYVLARELLDKEHAAILGDHLKFCLKEGFINRHRLTAEQRHELGVEFYDA